MPGCGVLACAAQNGVTAQNVSFLLLPVVEDERWRKSMGMPENWGDHPLWKLRAEGAE